MYTTEFHENYEIIFEIFSEVVYNISKIDVVLVYFKMVVNKDLQSLN